MKIKLNFYKIFNSSKSSFSICTSGYDGVTGFVWEKHFFVETWHCNALETFLNWLEFYCVFVFLTMVVVSHYKNNFLSLATFIHITDSAINNNVVLSLRIG